MRPIAKINVRRGKTGIITLTVIGPMGSVIAGKAISIAEAQELHEKLGAAISALNEEPVDSQLMAKPAAEGWQSG